uniref:Uncharacterized protein n=1 Tax=Anguilla anguilla TaxID=7936 RepID=A0A0E9Q3E1_ANGAN
MKTYKTVDSRYRVGQPCRKSSNHSAEAELYSYRPTDFYQQTL